MKSIIRPSLLARPSPEHRRLFHDYFVTHLPSSSLHPDSRTSAGPNHHKLPRAESTPQDPAKTSRQPTSLPAAPDRNTTVVRIPLKSAKHHFGASSLRGSRPYNEDAFQAGTIEVPAFAKRAPLSVRRRPPGQAESKAPPNAGGDPQVFYFGVFDGHGGEECSSFLRDRLHGYVEEAAERFGIKSSLTPGAGEGDAEKGKEMRDALLKQWRDTVGGYFRRFKPEGFEGSSGPTLEQVLTFAFLKADLDFTSAQAKKHVTAAGGNDAVLDDRPLNEADVLSHPLKPASQNLTSLLKAPIGGEKRFKGGSTCSVALVSTPTPMPFWNPASPSTIAAAHVGDTRILLCRVSDGQAVPLTTNHHPSAPTEASRLRRYAATFVTDSFGEERMGGLANTRAFGDIASKAIGVSAEPQITTLPVAPGEYSFLTLVSDGVSGELSDQEIVDIIKEARTPEQASRDVTTFATEVSKEGDNATCLVVRLGGWERRNEGGGGSLGTAEMRAFKRRDAEDPRARRT